MRKPVKTLHPHLSRTLISSKDDRYLLIYKYNILQGIVHVINGTPFKQYWFDDDNSGYEILDKHLCIIVAGTLVHESDLITEFGKFVPIDESYNHILRQWNKGK